MSIAWQTNSTLESCWQRYDIRTICPNQLLQSSFQDLNFVLKMARLSTVQANNQMSEANFEAMVRSNPALKYELLEEEEVRQTV